MDVAAPFEIAHLCTPSAHTAYGIKGMGESGLIAAPAAVLNAVNDAQAAFGARLDELPASPERVIAAIESATAGDDSQATGAATRQLLPVSPESTILPVDA